MACSRRTAGQSCKETLAAQGFSLAPRTMESRRGRRRLAGRRPAKPKQGQGQSPCPCFVCASRTRRPRRRKVRGEAFIPLQAKLSARNGRPASGQEALLEAPLRPALTLRFFHRLWLEGSFAKTPAEGAAAGARSAPGGAGFAGPSSSQKGSGLLASRGPVCEGRRPPAYFRQRFFFPMEKAGTHNLGPRRL